MFGKMFGKKKDMSTSPGLSFGKEQDLGLGPEFGDGLGAGFPPMQQPAAPSLQSYPQQAEMKQLSLEKDIQLISAKLDSLKAILDNISQRLTNLERIAQEPEHHEVY